MSEERLDAERLAMLLDGRLPAEERERLLAEIAADPDAAAELAAAAVALREASGTGAGEGAAPRSGVAGAPSARPDSAPPFAARALPGTWRRWRPLLAAASLVIVAAMGAGIWRATRASGIDRTFTAIGAVRPAGAMPDDWSDPPWARTRGGTGAAALPAVSAMLGARMADLELAVRLEPERVADLTRSSTTLVRQIPGSGPALATWTALADSAPDARRIAKGREALEPLVDPAAYELGLVLEGIRVALLAGDDEAVRTLAARLTALSTRDELPAPVRREAARVAVMLAADATTARNRDERLRAVDEAFRAVF